MRPAAEHPLMELARAPGRHLWIGNHPPFDFDNLFLPGCTNARAPASRHGKYDTVWCHEPDLASFPPECVPLLLDEMVRLLADDGRLLFRYTQNDLFTVVHLKRFLGRHPFLSADIEYESHADGLLHTVVRVRRQHVEAYRSDRWTFAVLTLGNRKPNVVAYLESIREQDPGRRHEILICGPRAAEYERFGVRYVDRTYSTKFADICAKKNDLAELASHPNLLVAHDRYRLDPGFLDGFADYGYDWDFLTVRQGYPNGREFPTYCALSKHAHTFQWTPPVALTDVNRVYPTHFLNGGLLGFKTHTLRALPFNELVFWNQAEDCELTRWMQDHSLPPRINLFSSATVLGLTPKYTEKFAWEGTPPPKPAALPAPPEPAAKPNPLVRGRRYAHRHYRKFAAAGMAAVAASQAAVLYLLLSGKGVGR